MDKRFNPDCGTFDEIVEYFKGRAVQLLRFDYKLDEIHETEWGGYAIFLDKKTYMYISPYITPVYRGKGIYEQFMRQHKYLPILTSDDCGIEEYLKYKQFGYHCPKIYTDYYKIISEYYGEQKAVRSGVLYMNHIDEGLAILNWTGLSTVSHDHVFAAYCYHPILQMDDDLLFNVTQMSLQSSNCVSMIGRMSREAIVYAMEYRSVANEYLSKRVINSMEEIRISPLRAVNWMLIADKVQNRKDFELYHEGKHQRSEELDHYFKMWLKRLNVTEERYREYKEKLIVNPKIIKS